MKLSSNELAIHLGRTEPLGDFAKILQALDVPSDGGSYDVEVARTALRRYDSGDGQCRAAIAQRIQQMDAGERIAARQRLDAVHQAERDARQKRLEKNRDYVSAVKKVEKLAEASAAATTALRTYESPEAKLKREMMVASSALNSAQREVEALAQKLDAEYAAANAAGVAA